MVQQYAPFLCVVIELGGRIDSIMYIPEECTKLFFVCGSIGVWSDGRLVFGIFWNRVLNLFYLCFNLLS
jgi:hypothetical protein